MGFVCRDSSPEELLAIVDASHTDRSEDACRGRLHFLQQYVSQREPTPNLVATLKREAESFVGANWSATDDHIWNEAVGLCFAQGTLGRAEILLRAVAEKAHQRSYLSLEALLASLGGTISEMATDPRRQFFVSHLGPTLAEDPDLVRSLGFGQESGSVLDHFEAGQIVEWISEDIEKRLWPVAHVAAVKAVPMPSLARQLLQRWSARPGVTGALSATFGSGSWVGPRSGYYEHLLGILQEWEKDALVAVRQFARTLRASYEREAKEQKKREEDRDW
jgi:hypothetical protein